MKGSELFTKKFWKDLAERSVSTFAQAVAGFATGLTLDVIQADLKGVLVTAGITGGYAVLKALAAHFKNPEQQSASLLDQPVVTAPGRHDGSQAPYDPATEGYLDGPGTKAAEQATAEVESDPVFRQNLVSSPLPPGHTRARPRDPKTGKFLPRPSDMVDVHGEAAYDSEGKKIL